MPAPMDPVAPLEAIFPASARFCAQLRALSHSLSAPNDPQTAQVLLRLAQPVRYLHFPIPWRNDQGQQQVSQGYIINYVNLFPAPCTLCIRPGLTPDQALSQGFSALLENALAGQPGSFIIGADCPCGALSDGESLAFCRALAEALLRLCPQPPALALADMELPAREMGYLLGQWESLLQQSCRPARPPLERPQAAGYGLCYFVHAALQAHHRAGLNGKTVLIRGTGPQAIYAAQKATQMGAQVIAIGDSSGYLAVPRLSMTALKALLHTPLDAVAPEHYCREPEGLWPIPADVVLLCDRDFSLDEAHAKALVAAGRSAVAEGAALTCTPKARQVLESGGALVCPGAAAGAGAALLRSLDTQLTAWEADKRLRAAMRALFQALHTAYPADLTRAAHLTAVRRLQGALHAYGDL